MANRIELRDQAPVVHGIESVIAENIADPVFVEDQAVGRPFGGKSPLPMRAHVKFPRAQHETSRCQRAEFVPVGVKIAIIGEAAANIHSPGVEPLTPLRCEERIDAAAHFRGQGQILRTRYDLVIGLSITEPPAARGLDDRQQEAGSPHRGRVGGLQNGQVDHADA